jgi:hypothetical protein
MHSECYAFLLTVAISILEKLKGEGENYRYIVFCLNSGKFDGKRRN